MSACPAAMAASVRSARRCAKLFSKRLRVYHVSLGDCVYEGAALAEWDDLQLGLAVEGQQMPKGGILRVWAKNVS